MQEQINLFFQFSIIVVLCRIADKRIIKKVSEPIPSLTEYWRFTGVPN